MHLHHLNCGTLPSTISIPGICYCLLWEAEDGLVLVDAGLGTQDYLRPTVNTRLFTLMNRVPCNLAETALHQVIGLGYSPDQVRDIVLTHLHLDHAGGLPDFPTARVHLHRAEFEAAQHPRGYVERFSYVPAHWRHHPHWVLHSEPDTSWYGFDSLHVLGSGPGEVRLIPLFGHTPGHCGVAVRDDERWWLLCGDAAYPFYNARWMQRHGHPPKWLVGLVERLAGPPSHLQRLMTLWHEYGTQVRLISSHDYSSFAELSGGNSALT